MLRRALLRASTWLILAFAGATNTRGDEERVLHVDFSRAIGRLKPLHGLNQGPLAAGGLIDLTPEFKALRPPLIRLHDCHWPNPDIVDIHAVFPDFSADPEKPESYDFRRTDEYIAAIRASGAQVVYRLGESIEHTTHRRFVHPPPDVHKWAAICAGIVRHYNEGWANGFHHGIRYWEIWNEPENRPACWTGSDQQYFDLYRAASRALKSRWPELKIGGPAVGATGTLKDRQFAPTEFVRAFVELCQRESLPLDFFSWHRYTDAPQELSERARNIRRLLDEHGFQKTENHLNEWNFLPGKTWAPTQRSSSAEERAHFYDQMSGPAGAAFIVAALREMQDAPVDVANFFRAEPGAFGLFNEHGVPQANYWAMHAFRQMLDCPQRVSVSGERAGQFSALAGVGEKRDRVSVLISELRNAEGKLELRWPALPWTTASEARVVAITREGTVRATTALPAGVQSWQTTLKGSGVLLVTITPAATRNP